LQADKFRARAAAATWACSSGVSSDELQVAYLYLQAAKLEGFCDFDKTDQKIRRTRTKLDRFTTTSS